MGMVKRDRCFFKSLHPWFLGMISLYSNTLSTTLNLLPEFLKKVHASEVRLRISMTSVSRTALTDMLHFHYHSYGLTSMGGTAPSGVLSFNYHLYAARWSQSPGLAPSGSFSRWKLYVWVRMLFSTCQLLYHWEELKFNFWLSRSFLWMEQALACSYLPEFNSFCTNLVSYFYSQGNLLNQVTVFINITLTCKQLWEDKNN